jgi:hypothetical protein
VSVEIVRPSVPFTETGRDGVLYIAKPWFRFLESVMANVNAAERAWPVGSVFITTSAEEPFDLFGFGTWQAFGAGRVLVGLDSSDTDFDTIEEIGGAKTATPVGTVSQPTFTGDALAAHVHGPGTLLPSPHTGTAVAPHASHTHEFTQDANEVSPNLVEESFSGVAVSGTTGNESQPLTHSVTQPNDHTMSGETEAVSAGTPSGAVSQPTFTGNAMSIQQKYIAVKFWKRTA